MEQPLEFQDQEEIENYYKDGTALYSVAIEDGKEIDAVSDIRKIIGDDNAMTGVAVSTAVATESTVSEIQKIAVSFVTNVAGNILQLAVSLDYSVFLIHRFEECKKEAPPKEAMCQALCKSTSSILASGLTTVIGFLALALMRFKSDRI